MKWRARGFGPTVICLTVVLVGCSGGTQTPGGQTYAVGRASPIASLPGTVTPVPPAPHADPDPEATDFSDVNLDTADFLQGADEQTFTVTNESNFSVDLDEWSVVIKSSTSERIGFPAGLVLAPRQSITVHTKIGTNSSTDVFLGLPVDVAPHVYTPGDPISGFIDIVLNKGPEYFRSFLPATSSNR